MPKMKTKRAAAKRFKINGSGHLKRNHAFRRHKAHSLTKKQRRQLAKPGLVHPTDEKRIKDMFQG